MVFNVLVVDDSAVMRGMIIKTLRLSGLPMGDVHEAGNGQEGLRALRKHWIDLALVDINMPVMNGEELIDQIRQEPELASVRIIVVSTESSAARIDALRQLGAEFVHKPFTPETLRDTVLRVTGVTNEQLAGDTAVPGRDVDF